MGTHTEERGAGDVILCLHGIGSSARSFAAQLDELGQQWRVIAWDAPGYGASADPAGPPGMDGYADAAADLLRSLGAAPAVVIGLSFGGVVAVRMSLRFPNLVRGLVIADSTPGSGISTEGAMAMRRRGTELQELGAREFAQSRASRLLSDVAPPGLVDTVAATMADSIRLPGYAYAAEAMAETDHRAKLADIAVPTLVLCGDADRVTPPELSKDMASRIPNAEFAIVPNAGHLSNQENPVAFNALVRSFVIGLEGS